MRNRRPVPRWSAGRPGPRPDRRCGRLSCGAATPRAAAPHWRH
jgi:hypothetical protein